MTHEVLMRVSAKIAQEFPAEATHLIVAAREVRRMELALDEIVADHRRGQVVDLHQRRTNDVA
jgi:NADP-dependent 3-hydroxy acid dehydrogenase YdfG